MPKVKTLITILMVVLLTFLGILFFRSVVEKNNSINNEELQSVNTSSLSNNIEIKSNYKYETREIIVDNNGDNIYGILYRPITENKVPTIIFSHRHFKIVFKVFLYKV